MLHPFAGGHEISHHHAMDRAAHNGSENAEDLMPLARGRAMKPVIARGGGRYQAQKVERRENGKQNDHRLRAKNFRRSLSGMQLMTFSLLTHARRATSMP